MEVHNLGLVDLEDHRKEALDAVVTFGDEDDKGMAAVVDAHKVVPAEEHPKI